MRVSRKRYISEEYEKRIIDTYREFIIKNERLPQDVFFDKDGNKILVSKQTTEQEQERFLSRIFTMTNFYKYMLVYDECGNKKSFNRVAETMSKIFNDYDASIADYYYTKYNKMLYEFEELDTLYKKFGLTEKYQAIAITKEYIEYIKKHKRKPCMSIWEGGKPKKKTEYTNEEKTEMMLAKKFRDCKIGKLLREEKIRDYDDFPVALCDIAKELNEVFEEVLNETILNNKEELPR